MFTGIIEAVGQVVGLGPVAGGARRLEVEAGGLLDGLRAGASVAVNGACLTLVETRGTVGGFEVVPETWRQTTLGRLRVGARVNLERALRVGDRLDGHLVQGHVDGVGTVQRVERTAGGYQLWIAATENLMRYIVRKGAIALDGTSLTVVEVVGRRFSVALIPATLARTTLGTLRPGRQVNLETDILARLVVDRLEGLAAVVAPRAPAGLSWQRLGEAGFVS